MSQAILPEGLKIGSGGFYIFAPVTGGDPNVLTKGLLIQTSVSGRDSVALGSVFVDVTTGRWFIKTAKIDVGSGYPTGVWTPIP